MFGANEKAYFLQIGCEALENDFFLAVFYFDVIEIKNCAHYYSDFCHSQLFPHTASHSSTECHDGEGFGVDQFAYVIDKAIWVEGMSLLKDALFVLNRIDGGVEDGAFFYGNFDIIVDSQKMIGNCFSGEDAIG